MSLAAQGWADCLWSPKAQEFAETAKWGGRLDFSGSQTCLIRIT